MRVKRYFRFIEAKYPGCCPFGTIRRLGAAPYLRAGAIDGKRNHGIERLHLSVVEVIVFIHGSVHLRGHFDRVCSIAFRFEGAAFTAIVIDQCGIFCIGLFAAVRSSFGPFAPFYP